MDKENAIEVREMSKTFKVQSDRANSLKALLVVKRKNRVEQHEVLKNINLDIKKGETVALIGTNGSGKSTLLKLMTKIIYPTEGTIKTQGKLTSLLELGAGFHPDFSGRENIYFNASIFGLTKKEIDKRIDSIIEFSELEAFIDEPIRTYSSGMYMRLAFSVAINVDAEILLIDEILAVGDQHFQDKCYAKLSELSASDKTIVIVSHSLDVVKKLCSRDIWVYKDSIRIDGAPAYVISEYLKQSAIDNKEKKKEAIKLGTAESRGATFIDKPIDFTYVNENTKELKISGWSISDNPNSHCEVCIGKTLIATNPESRKDVFEVYAQDYAGFIDVDTIGWYATVDPNDFRDQVDEAGNLYITSKVILEDGKVIAEAKVTVFVED